ncbi:MAG TPA: nitroreductase family protein [Planctomycetaceae bacterium]|nr:nitroreductase family protein [Planctomycetaceae bacterium]
MSSLRKLISAIVPATLRHRLLRWRQLAKLKANYRYDIDRFIEHGCPFREFDAGGELRAYIRMLSHGLEKGMSFRDVRKGFGLEKARELMRALRRYLERFECHDELATAVACLEQYVAFHRTRGDANPALEAELEQLRSRLPRIPNASPPAGGVLQVTRDEIWQQARRDLTGFFASRYSIRQFSPEPVALDLIARAVRMAQKTPSVCNRQSARVYVYDNDDTGAGVLACQNGNRGFGHLADKVLIVTADLQHFLSIGERNQCWIDGGMFAMSLIYALHSLGLGTCCLNWSVEQDADERLRRAAGIAASENVIMLLAVGHLPEELGVARSERKDLNEVLRDRTAALPPEPPQTASEPPVAEATALRSV